MHLTEVVELQTMIIAHCKDIDRWRVYWLVACLILQSVLTFRGCGCGAAAAAAAVINCTTRTR